MQPATRSDQLLARGLDYLSRTGELMPCSTSEQLMIAFAAGRWDLLKGTGGNVVDPLNAWAIRLNADQRQAVLHHRTDLTALLGGAQ